MKSHLQLSPVRNVQQETVLREPREPPSCPNCDLKFMIKQLFQPCSNNKIKPACVELGKASVP